VTYFSVFDIETDYIEGELHNKFTLFAYYDGESDFVTTSEEEAINFLMGLEGVIYAHNAGKFDTLWVIDCLFRYNQESRIVNTDVLLIASSVAMLQVKTDVGILEIRDSLKILQSSLKKLANKVGMEKYYMDMTSKRSEETERQRALSDCIILYRLIEEYNALCLEFDSKPRLTTAAQTMDIFFRKYGGLDCANTQEELQRKALYGGRVEVFQSICENVTAYDVNSLYPFVMDKLPYPKGHPVKVVQPSFADIRHWLGFAKCRVRIPYMHVPPLPYKSGKLIFPYGVIEGFWCITELVYAVSLGCEIESIDYAYCWAKAKSPFSAYINDLYERRKKTNNEFQNYFYKILMNSLFGKFAQSREQEKVWFCDDISEALEQGAEGVISDYYGLVSKKTESRSRRIIPIISAQITAYARVYLHSLIMKAVSEGLTIYYCDTDSLFLDGEYPNGVGELALGASGEYLGGDLFGGVMGQLKRIHEKASAQFYAPKLYTIQENGVSTHKAKGINSKLVASLTRLDEKGELFFDSHLFSFRESMRSGGEKPIFGLTRQGKKLQFQDTKRVWNGNISSPIKIGE